LIVDDFGVYDRSWLTLKEAICKEGMDKSMGDEERTPTSRVHLVLQDDSVWEIGVNALRFSMNLVKVTLPHVDIIDQAAFFSCDNLAEVDAPNTTEVHASSFQKCGALQSVTAPKLTTIADRTFFACSALETLKIPRTCRLTTPTSSSNHQSAFTGTQLEVEAKRHEFANDTLAFAKWAAEPASRMLMERDVAQKQEIASLTEELDIRAKNVRLTKQCAALQSTLRR
jgi:hypothetical protein